MSPAAAICIAPATLPAGKIALPTERNADFGSFLGGLIDPPAAGTTPSGPPVQAGAARKTATPEAAAASPKKPAAKAAAPDSAGSTPLAPAAMLPGPALAISAPPATPRPEMPAGGDDGTDSLPGPDGSVQGGSATAGRPGPSMADRLDDDAGPDTPETAAPDTRADPAAADAAPAPLTKGKPALAASAKPGSLRAIPDAAGVASQPGASPGPAGAQAALSAPAAQPAVPNAGSPAANAATPPDTSASAGTGQPASPPAAQLGHALAALHVGADGSSKLTIRLDPAELGQVRVEITRGQDGASSVSVAVERVETLGRLQADLTHLHLALDRAGVPEQRSLVLHLAPQDQPGGAPTGSFSGSQSGASGGQGGQNHGFPSPARTALPAGAGSSSDQQPGSQAAGSRQASYRRIDTGIDITA